MMLTAYTCNAKSWLHRLTLAAGMRTAGTDTYGLVCIQIERNSAIAVSVLSLCVTLQVQ